MSVFAITHPHALAAVRLAHAAPHVSRGTITQQLQASGMPRGLFILACVLRAASAKGL